MGWRFIWTLIIERDDRDRGEGSGPEWPGLVKWAIVGLAVLGVAAVIGYRVWSR